MGKVREAGVGGVGVGGRVTDEVCITQKKCCGEETAHSTTHKIAHGVEIVTLSLTTTPSSDSPFSSPPPSLSLSLFIHVPSR